MLFYLIAQAPPDSVITLDGLAVILRVVVLLVVGLPLLRFIGNMIARYFKTRLTAQHAMLIRKGIFYVGSVIIILSVLRELKFDLTALLGAAGIIGVAIGFASQTSLSNLISGLFLISEKPFEVGDLIKVGETVGMVLSIDLLSIKLRMFDNRFVRIPNQTIINTEVVNITRFPIRRFEINMGVAYKEDIRQAIKVLQDVITRNPYALDEPEPLVVFTGFGDSQLNIFIGIWHAREEFAKLRSSILPEIKERLDAEGIEIPFPHRTIYTGDVTRPFPLHLTREPHQEPQPEPQPEPPEERT